MKLKKEKSCGCIILKNKKVLLVYEKNSNLSFSKMFVT